MIEIARAVMRHVAASKVFDIQFISDAGDFEQLFEEEGFPLKKIEPRLTQEQIERFAKVDRWEELG